MTKLTTNDIPLGVNSAPTRQFRLEEKDGIYYIHIPIPNSTEENKLMVTGRIGIEYNTKREKVKERLSIEKDDMRGLLRQLYQYGIEEGMTYSPSKKSQERYDELQKKYTRLVEKFINDIM